MPMCDASGLPSSDLLVLIRHPPPDADPAAPAANWTLGVDGVLAAERLVSPLRSLGLDLLVSSVEPKALEATRIVAAGLDLPWQTGHDLHEHVRSAADWLPKPLFEASVRRFFAEPSRAVFGEESADAAATRFETSVNALARAHRGRRLAVLSHGRVISAHLERRYGLDGFTTWQRLGLPSFVVVERRLHQVVDLVAQV